MRLDALPAAAWRRLLTPASDGPTNMAIDEAVLLAVAEGRSPPTLRFFAWSPPCLSLGYAQPAADADAGRLRERGWDLVRRPTGGRAILHADELTYSIIAPMDEPRVRGGVVESYRQLSAGLLRGLEILGLAAQADAASGRPSRIPPALNPICFEVPSAYEITADGRKLIGSAQVRKQGVVLQHGTLPLAGDLGRICDALSYETEAARTAARPRVQRRAATMADVLGREVSWDEAARALGQGLAAVLNLTLEDGRLSEVEAETADRLRAEKYAAAAWNLRI